MLEGHSNVLFQGGIYIWGGKTAPRVPDAPVHYSNALYLLDPEVCIRDKQAPLHSVKLSSEARGTVPRGRAFHSAVLFGGKSMLVTGGLSDADGVEASFADIPTFDMEQRLWTTKTAYGDVPRPRCHHVSVVYGDTLFVHGGYPLLSDRQHDMTPEEMEAMQHAMYDVYELNITTLRWRRLQVTHTPNLWGHTAVAFGSNVVAFGGVDVTENAESGSVAVWHAEKKTWRWADFPDTGVDLRRAMHSAVAMAPTGEDGRMLVFGGVSFRSNEKLPHLLEFNLMYGSWKELHANGDVPAARIGHSALAFNNCMFVIGGTVDDTPAGSVSGGANDLVAYVYNVSLNTWHSCRLVAEAAAPPSVAPIARPALQGWGHSGESRTQQRALDQWGESRDDVQESLSRAKAIQSLADTALQELDGPSIAPRPEHLSLSRAAPDSVDRPVDSHQEAAAAVQASRMRNVQLGADADEMRQAMARLERENAALRRQLEEAQRLGAAPAAHPNPYEVPIYNPTLARAAEGSQDLLRAVKDAPPRLNLNVASDPRSVGGAPGGFMSRQTVSSLVANIGRQGTNASAPDEPRPGGSSLDPMSYLTKPAGYDDLLARNPPPAAIPVLSGSTQHGQQVPLSLQPLLSLMTGLPEQSAPAPVTMPPPTGPVVPHAQPAPPQTHTATAAPPQVQAAPTTPARGLRSAGLGRVVSGQSSLLTL